VVLLVCLSTILLYVFIFIYIYISFEDGHKVRTFRNITAF